MNASNETKKKKGKTEKKKENSIDNKGPSH